MGKLGWAVDIRTHRISTLIDKLLIPDWDKDAHDEHYIQSNTFNPDVELATEDETRLGALKKSWHWPWPGKGKHKGKGKGKEDDKKRKDGDGHDNPDDPDHVPEKDPAEVPAPTATTTPLPSHPPKKDKKSHVPPAEIDKECKDCFKWEFFDDDGSNGNRTCPVSTTGLHDPERKRRKCW